VPPGDTRHEFKKIAIVPEYFAGSAVVLSAPVKVPVPSPETTPEIVLLIVSMVPAKCQSHGSGSPQETQNQSIVIESPATVPVKRMVCHWLAGTTPGVPGGYKDGHPEVRACPQYMGPKTDSAPWFIAKLACIRKLPSFIEISQGAYSETMICVVPDFVASCVEVAVIVAVPKDIGVKTPEEVIVPSVADHVTAGSYAPVPCTVAAQVEV
jgi:hypothetical protein